MNDFPFAIFIVSKSLDKIMTAFFVNYIMNVIPIQWFALHAVHPTINICHYLVCPQMVMEFVFLMEQF